MPDKKKITLWIFESDPELFECHEENLKEARAAGRIPPYRVKFFRWLKDAAGESASPDYILHDMSCHMDCDELVQFASRRSRSIFGLNSLLMGHVIAAFRAFEESLKAEVVYEWVNNGVNDPGYASGDFIDLIRLYEGLDDSITFSKL